jgi:RNA polymerase sigma-70 factor (ECF subfamily)
MSVGTTTPLAGRDPVRAALADREAWTRLVAAARAFLAGRPGVYAQDADDIAQQAVARAIQRSDTFDPARDVVCWLVGFVANVAREHVKRQGRDRLRYAPPQLDDLAADLGRPVGGALADREFVDGLVARLPATDREIVRLVYAEGLTFAEVGARVGVTEPAARVRHFRVLKHLRELAGGGGWGRDTA